MKLELLLKSIAKHVTLTELEKHKLLNLFETKEYKAKTILLEEGEICTDSFFVLD